MINEAEERRLTHRYDIHLPVRFRISLRESISRWGTGVTCDISSNGVSFRCRKPLPVGAHVEMVIHWPARHDDEYPIELHCTGFVMRSSATKAAVTLTSRRFHIEMRAAQPMGAIA